jgi:hypothetical protein|tara:strand:- start:2439 stop:2672 length:234 start_codon:yes stop_codon:yes gene_type:complete
MPEFTPEEYAEALDSKEPQHDWPNYEQEAAMRSKVRLMVYALLFDGHVDPVRVRSSGLSPGNISDAMVDRLIELLEK